jgi:hypothetical protein
MMVGMAIWMILKPIQTGSSFHEKSQFTSANHMTIAFHVTATRISATPIIITAAKAMPPPALRARSRRS